MDVSVQIYVMSMPTEKSNLGYVHLDPALESGDGAWVLGFNIIEMGNYCH